MSAASNIDGSEWVLLHHEKKATYYLVCNVDKFLHSHYESPTTYILSLTIMLEQRGGEQGSQGSPQTIFGFS